jgi:hypothetical protein
MFRIRERTIDKIAAMDERRQALTSTVTWYKSIDRFEVFGNDVEFGNIPHVQVN